MRKTGLTAGVIALGFTTTIAAHAAIITEDSGLLTQNVFGTQGSGSVSFSQFNTSVGTLNGVTVTLSGITQPQLEVFNLSSAAGSGSGSTAVTYTLTGPGITALKTPGLSSGLQTVSVPGGFGNISSSPAGTPQFFDVSFSPTDLADYSGTGSVTLGLSELFSTVLTPLTGEVAGGGAASANFDIQLAFNVPEPTSVALFGTGLLGFGFIRRRQRS